MSDLLIDLAALDRIAVGLDEGSHGLEELAGTVPSGISGGPMTAVIAGMLSQIVNSAGNVSTSLAGAADLVRLSRRYYERADADSAARLDQIQEAMKP